MHAMIDVLTFAFVNIQNYKNTGLMLFDIKKAFETVNHSIPLNKIQHYGTRGTTLKLFDSFLADKDQCVNTHNVNSNKKPIQFGFPKGPVFSPLLLTLYVSNGEPKLFVDDTRFFCSMKI